MRMIDADALIAKLKDVCQHAEEPIAQMFICAAINDIKHAPTIEPSAQSNTFNALESLDCIDRQAALDALKRAEALTRAFGYHYVIDTIQELPSAQPERNKGEWIGTEFDGYADGNPVYYEWKCSACGCVVEDEEPIWNYCPNCGADMQT